MEPSASESILEFWFGRDADEAAVIEQKTLLWWGGSPTLDQDINARFGALREAAIAGRLSAWEEQPRQRLALILLVDQFSRNIFRGKPEAFEHDAVARHWCLDGIARGHDRRLRAIERVFFYLPLEHSESRQDQASSVRFFTALPGELPESRRGLFAPYADFALQHQRIIERYKRFPHRNAILGRASTTEELEFLKQPGSSF